MYGERNRPSTPSHYNSASDDSNKNHSNKRMKSTIKSVLEAARATIQNPSRPFTPRDSNRKLFLENEYLVRPNSAYSISRESFATSLRPINKKPLSAGTRRLLATLKDAEQLIATNEQQPQLSQQQEEPELETGVLDKTWDEIKSLLTFMDCCTDIESLLGFADQICDKVVEFEAAANSNDDQKEVSVHESRKRIILHTLSKMMDYTDPRLLLKLSAIILKLCPEGLFLLSTTKLLFKLSKVDSNDQLFREEKIITLIIDILRKNCRKEISLSNEILIYSIATLKNISLEAHNQTILIENETIPILSMVLAATEYAVVSELESVDKHAQLLVQVTATLRNLAISGTALKQLVDNDTLYYMISLMSQLKTHSEFIHNCVRVISKISVDKLCRDALLNLELRNSGEDVITILVEVMSCHKRHKPIIIRLCFVLGNLTYSHEEARQIMKDESSVSLLMELLELYNQEDLELANNSEEKKKLQECTDLLTKLIRLIANLALIEESALLILQSNGVNNLLEIIERKSVETSEELILNTVRCITNLSFYISASAKQQRSRVSLFKDQLKIATLLSPLLLHDHVDAVYETARVFGNLSRDQEVRRWIHEKKIDELLIVLLHHSNLLVVEASCGIIMNITSDPTTLSDSLPIFKEYDIVSKLLDALDIADLTLVDIILKIVYNLSLAARNELFSENQSNILLNTIPELLNSLEDDESAIAYSCEKVATSLLEALR